MPEPQQSHVDDKNRTDTHQSDQALSATPAPGRETHPSTKEFGSPTPCACDPEEGKPSPREVGRLARAMLGHELEANSPGAPSPWSHIQSRPSPWPQALPDQESGLNQLPSGSSWRSAFCVSSTVKGEGAGLEP